MFHALPRLSLKPHLGDLAGLCFESLKPTGTGGKSIYKHEGKEWKIRTDPDHLLSVLDMLFLTHRQTTSVHGVQEGICGVSMVLVPAVGQGVSGLGSSVPGMVPNTMCDFLKEDHRTKICESLPPTSLNLSVPTARENPFCFLFCFYFKLKKRKIS